MVEAPFLFLSYPYPRPFHLPSSSWQMDLPPSFLLFSFGPELPFHPFSPLVGFSVHLHLTCWCPGEPLIQMVLTFPEIPLQVSDLLFFARPVWDALAPHAGEAQGVSALPSSMVLAFCHPPSLLVLVFLPLLSWKALAVWLLPFWRVRAFFLPPSLEVQVFCLLPFGEAQPCDCRPSWGVHSSFLHLFWTTQDALLLLFEEALASFHLLFLKFLASLHPLVGSVQLAWNLLAASPPPSWVAVALGHGLPGGVGARGPVVCRLQVSLMAQMAAAWHQSRP